MNRPLHLLLGAAVNLAPYAGQTVILRFRAFDSVDQKVEVDRQVMVQAAP